MGNEAAISIEPGRRFARGDQSDEYLKLSSDRKVSPQGWLQESNMRWVPQVPNSFGLPAGESCPGATEFCTSCYAVNTENGQGVKELVDHNLNLLQEAGDVDAMSSLLTEAVGRYEDVADRKRLTEKERIFRIHWDGDFFSVDYAKAWAKTIREFPDIQFWTYTRSFTDEVNVIPELVGIKNLTVYLSTDEYNVDAAHETAEQYPELLLALCAEDYRIARELARDRTSSICPENIGRLALMDNGVGACVSCQWCPQGKRDVLFSTSHKEDANPQLVLPFGEVPVSLSKKPQ